MACALKGNGGPIPKGCPNAMRTLFLSFIAGALTIAAAAVSLLPVTAAPRPTTERISKTTAELLVFEAKGCAYCFIFRRDVVPGYQQSPRARDVPMRFIDVRKADLTRLQLRAPLTMLPTVILMEHGREVDRISGYMGPEPFFHMVSRLMK
jgi:thioredoxin-related protein